MLLMTSIAFPLSGLKWGLGNSFQIYNLLHRHLNTKFYESKYQADTVSEVLSFSAEDVQFPFHPILVKSRLNPQIY